LEVTYKAGLPVYFHTLHGPADLIFQDYSSNSSSSMQPQANLQGEIWVTEQQLPTISLTTLQMNKLPPNDVL